MIIGTPGHGVIEDIVPGNWKSLLQQWLGFSDPTGQVVEYVTMDFQMPFNGAMAATIPDAQNKIVHDKLHLVRTARDAAEQIRRFEMDKCLGNKDTDSDKRPKPSRQASLRSGTDLEQKHQDRVDAIDE